MTWKALNEIGEPAVPSLFATLRATNSPTKVWVVKQLNRLPFVRVSEPRADRLAVGAQYALQPGMPTARAAIPRLVEMLGQPDVNGRRLPIWAASFLASSGDDAVAPLLGALRNANASWQVAAANALGLFECQGWSRNYMIIRDYVGPYHAPRMVTPDNGEQIYSALRALAEGPASKLQSVAYEALANFEENNSWMPKLQDPRNRHPRHNTPP